MNNNKLYPGLVLVFIGLAFLLHSMHLLQFHWHNFLYLWPLVIIVAGINLLLGNRREPWALAARIAVLIICFGVLLFGNFDNYNHNSVFRFNREYHHYNNRDNDNDPNPDDQNDDDDDADNKPAASNVYTEPIAAATRSATLNISGGGVHYTLTDTTNALMTARTQERFGNFVLNHTSNNGSDVLNFKLKANHASMMNLSDHSNTADLKLNPTPVWDIDINGGANELNFDLSKFKIREVKLNGGATDCTFKMGLPLAETHVRVTAGASSVTINVPEAAACDITTSTGLSSNNIEGFTSVGSNHYQTAGFNAAASKLYISINGGISDFNVKRY